MSKIQYKSFFWSVGTTSFRTADFNFKIEKQLLLIKEFNALNNNQKWDNETQKSYYNFLKNNNFFSRDAKRPDKDARQNTSGLVDIGFLDGERNITDAGETLLNITVNQKISKDNFLEISNDSYIYLKQMLKTSNKIDTNIVRPFVVFLYFISRFDFLSYDEFKYLLPLCINKEITMDMEENIKKLREYKISIDNIIIKIIMNMDNYKKALEYFIDNKADENVISKIGMNRKSSKYTIPYYNLFKALENVVFNNKDKKSVSLLFEETKNIKGHASNYWKKYLFNTSSEKSITKQKEKSLNDIPIFKVKNEKELKKIFFEILHLFKSKSTLDDYFDLNRRYFRTTDIVIFEDNKVELDIIPKCYFNLVTDNILDIGFVKGEHIDKNIEIEEIADFLKVNERKLYSNISNTLGVKIKTKEDAKNIITNEKYKRFNKLIDERFNVNVILDLLNKFEKREDKDIRKIVTDNADIPTIFEYILAISWYIISGRKGKILEYMNMSLEADLLPKTHAGGGEADITYKYEEEKEKYPKHTLLIEATLSEKTNQRRMEMEPVSRHLGDYILKTKEKDSYCIFIATFLHQNVISDFRNRKTYPYFSNDNSQRVDGLKIIPISTNEIKSILEKSMSYDSLYNIFNNAYHSNIDILEWYQKEITEKITT